MEAAERALVLKVGRFKEHDAWVRLLHPGLGVQNAFAFGGLRSRRRFVGCLDPLKLVLFTLREARGGRYHTLEEGTVLNAFEAIRGDARRLGAARHCLKLVEAVQIGAEGAREIFEFTVASLDALERDSGPPEFAPTAFKARLLHLQGLLPDLSVCNACGRPVQALSELVLEVDSGRLLCQDCRTQSQAGLALCPGSARTLDWLAKASPQEWGGLRVSQGIGRECRRVLELMLGWRLGLAWNGARYEKT
jgi:DNA repair protein RecO (recombination protein O)